MTKEDHLAFDLLLGAIGVIFVLGAKKWARYLKSLPPSLYWLSGAWQSEGAIFFQSVLGGILCLLIAAVDAIVTFAHIHFV